MLNVEYLDVEWAKNRRLELEVEYPDFTEVAGMDLALCCKHDEIADRYGYGPATNAWREYDTLLFMLGER